MKILGMTTGVLVALLWATAGEAAGFKITTIDDNGKFQGCLANNTDAGLGVVAVGSNVGLLSQSKSYNLAKDAAVTGSWSVDGGKANEFSSKASEANVVTLDVPNSAEAVTALTTGKQLEVTANGTKAQFDLAGMGQAFGDLGKCMETQKAPQ